MADEFGPAEPADPDPVNEWLRELVRETEPLAVLAGPASARSRGERSRARRRTGAVCLAAALALGIGSLQLLPRLGTDRSHTLPSGTASAPTTMLAARLQGELLPPGALPLHSDHYWVAVPDQLAGTKFPEKCAVTRLVGHPLAQAARAYRTTDGLVAHYHLYAMTGPAQAAHQVKLMDQLIKGKCASAKILDSSGMPLDSASPDAYATGRRTESTYHGSTTVIWLDQQGTYIALLDITGSSALPHWERDFSGANSWPDLCIARSLDRLSETGGTPDPAVDATARPDVRPTQSMTPSHSPPPGGSTVPPAGGAVPTGSSDSSSGTGTHLPTTWFGSSSVTAPNRC